MTGLTMVLTKWPMSFPAVIIISKSIGQGGITCGAIDEPRKSSKAIDEHVIINFHDKNVVIARFCNKNVVIARFRDKTAYVWGLRCR